MKAIQFSEYGDADVLKFVDIPCPDVAPGAVRIKIEAAGLNPADFKWRQGMFKDIVPVTLPHTLGYDIAGTVDAVGDSVSSFAPGDRVFAMLDAVSKGGYAEYAVCSQSLVAPVPDGLDFATAAALPTAGLTGFQMINEHIQPTSGARILITGALGAVGRFALFAARRRGAETIAAVRASQQDEARKLGASEIIALDSREQNYFSFDHVADTVGGPAVASLCKHLAPHGLIRTVSTTPIDPAGLTTEPVFVAVHPDVQTLEAIGGFVARGEFHMPIARRMKLEEAAEAHRKMESGSVGGKIILEP